MPPYSTCRLVGPWISYSVCDVLRCLRERNIAETINVITLTTVFCLQKQNRIGCLLSSDAHWMRERRVDEIC